MILPALLDQYKEYSTVQVFIRSDVHNQASFGAPSFISSCRSANAIKSKAMSIGWSTVCSCSVVIRPTWSMSEKVLYSLDSFRVQGPSLSEQSGRCPASALSTVSWVDLEHLKCSQECGTQCEPSRLKVLTCCQSPST